MEKAKIKIKTLETQREARPLLPEGLALFCFITL
jgi:hypothetical protein